MIHWGITDISPYVIQVLSLLIWLIIVYLLKLTTNGITFIRRSFWAFLGVLGIALLILRPQKVQSGGQKEVHLYTENLNITPQAEKGTYNNINRLINSESKNKVSVINIHGDGLTLEELSLIKDYKINFNPTKEKSGICNITIPDITEKEDWVLSGSWAGEEINTIELITPSAKIEKAELNDSLFSVNSIAPIAGQYLYTINAIYESGDTISELLPISVRNKTSWNLLSLSSHPSFELNYLKNFWTKLGYGFAQKTKISQEKYQSSFTNVNQIDLNKLSSTELSQFNFLLADNESWNGLIEVERSRILKAIKDNGLALLIVPDENQTEFKSLNHPTLTQSSDWILKSEATSTKLKKFGITNRKAWKKINFANTPIGYYKKYGLGKIMLLCIDDSYNLILSAENNKYQKLWSTIFSNLFSQYDNTEQIVLPKWLWANNQTKLEIITPQPLEQPPSLNDSIIISTNQYPFIDGFYNATIIPKLGYNRITLPPNNKDFQFYAHSNKSWVALKQKKLHKINKLAAINSVRTSVQSQLHRTDYPYFYWYLLSLLGFGALWLDERIK